MHFHFDLQSHFYPIPFTGVLLSTPTNIAKYKFGPPISSLSPSNIYQTKTLLG